MFAIVRLGQTDRQTLRDFARGIHSSPAVKLGFVLTGVEAREMYGAGNYGYVAARGSQDGQEQPTLREVGQSDAARLKTSRR
jgi:hypothetical protein